MKLSFSGAGIMCQ